MYAYKYVYLIKEGRAAEPLPVGVVECPVGVQQIQVEHLRTLHTCIVCQLMELTNTYTYKYK